MIANCDGERLGSMAPTAQEKSPDKHRSRQTVGRARMWASAANWSYAHGHGAHQASRLVEATRSKATVRRGFCEATIAGLRPTSAGHQFPPGSWSRTPLRSGASMPSAARSDSQRIQRRTLPPDVIAPGKTGIILADPTEG